MSEEKDSIVQVEQLILRIKEKSLIHQSLLDYLGISADGTSQNKKTEDKSDALYQILKEKFITTNKCEFRDLLETISHLWDTYQSDKEMKNKIRNLILILKNEMKNFFTEKEIISIFHYNKSIFILLIFIEQNILSIETIIQNINLMNTDDLFIIKFFYPEIRKYDEKYLIDIMEKKVNFGLREFVEENDQNLDKFNKIRKEGEIEPKIIELIREDKIDEFISLIEHFPIDLNAKIYKEDVLFDIDYQKLTPIEYSALFGSLKIFKYLFLNNVEIKDIIEDYKNSIIEYAIQGRNYEIFHLLEERKKIREELNINHQKYIGLSIKMHCNEIFEYLLTNYNNQLTEVMVNMIIINRNYQLFDQLRENSQIEFKNKAIISNIFSGFCENGNDEIVKILINHPNIDINLKDNVFH